MKEDYVHMGSSSSAFGIMLQYCHKLELEESGSQIILNLKNVLPMLAHSSSSAIKDSLTPSELQKNGEYGGSQERLTHSFH